MQHGAVIESISIMLISLLDKEIEKLPSTKFSVTLDVPPDDWEDDTQRINLFLYRISENTELKNQLRIREGKDRLRYPPLFLNLHYLITPYAREQKEAHRLMTETMRIFHDYLPLYLSGTEKHTHPLKIILEPLSIEDIHKIWSALHKPYHLSVSYCVHFACIESKREKKIELVQEREIHVDSMK